MLSRLQSGLWRRVKSFHYAFAGWHYVLRTQPNAWLHGLITLAVVALGVWLRLPVRDWAVLVLAIMLVWMAEFANTAVEAIVDMVMPRPHPLARVAKDVAAGTVLIGAVGAIIIGLLILGPPLWAHLFG